jgi:NAD(P)-dependent dehydrogenase (short-subunit alcohol dehydrogenase family)
VRIPAAVAGLRVLVTGGNSGIGKEAVRLLAERGADVLLGARDRGKGLAAAGDIGQTSGTIRVQELDLADLTHVEHAAAQVGGRWDRLDVLVNNAGVMATPHRQTVDGFELQLGTNHLGHVALTAHLLPLLLRRDGRPPARVVTVTSALHRMGRIHHDDLNLERGYDPWVAYGQSKLANLLFTFELERRAEAAGAPLEAVAVHPGWAATNLQAAGPRMSGSRLRAGAMRVLNVLFAQSPARGALPTVAAATSPHAAGGDVIGPRGPGQWRGRPTQVSVSAAARDEATAARLWEASLELTGVAFDLG